MSVSALLGGIIIAVATSLNLLVTGKVTGWSGILGGILTLERRTLRSNICLAAGLLLASLFDLQYRDGKSFEDPRRFSEGLSLTGFALAGFCVGLGTRLGNGCTSGHGVCGLPRLSVRSLVAVLTFMLFGVLTATLKSHSHFLSDSAPHDVVRISWLSSNQFTFFLLFCFAICVLSNVKMALDSVISLLTGFVFGLGLQLSGMTNRHTVLAFLTLDAKTWNSSLMFVMAGAVIFNFFSFSSILARPAPVIKSNAFGCKNTPKTVTASLVVGSGLFGIGWGLSGICPGPALANLVLGHPAMLLAFFPTLIAGNLLGYLWQQSFGPTKSKSM
eukprot:GILJ01004261.1.p1 GENE.GILJ01004261.1~~GILJ01004261.1.p1  ORF type:complete len:348 (+),score=39.86 GILJ01004261.1:56-1045(+)